MTKRPNHPGQRGFTLIELIIFIVVVSIGLAGILSVINTVVKSSADPMIRKQTIAIAESLLEEILLKDYAKPTGSTAAAYSGPGWPRNMADCVSDYSGYNTTAGIVDATGAGSGLSSYNISAVTVANATAADNAALAALIPPAKKITVSVTGPQGAVVSLTGYRACDLSSCPLP